MVTFTWVSNFIRDYKTIIFLFLSLLMQWLTFVWTEFFFINWDYLLHWNTVLWKRQVKCWVLYSFVFQFQKSWFNRHLKWWQMHIFLAFSSFIPLWTNGFSWIECFDQLQLFSLCSICFIFNLLKLYPVIIFYSWFLCLLDITPLIFEHFLASLNNKRHSFIY